MEQSLKEKSDSKLLRGILIGGAVGAIISLFDKGTRKNLKYRSEQAKELYHDFREDPSRYTEQWKKTYQEASSIVKEVQEDMKAISSTFNEVKESSNSALRLVKETQKDVKDIGSKVKEAGEELMK
ncbi:YtxH domain-containing protein [Pseudalkalibacillus caeni]|uniref:YtxH domain-containing protein n=1 Tax=Exobacillus caeni TaxID=2574798 RepID=A0A5R9EZ53_9BACL|nr:YtxH domain-containing protein [Pseudalkalibacillus caeni]TLS35739.1 YtxH domain-containing protein [Pseudalkalibacillus caeni]